MYRFISIKHKIKAKFDGTKKQIYQNNKRKFELCEAWKYLFDKAKHFKVANFVIEQLTFNTGNHNDKANEANRKTKNIWHRITTNHLISKYCSSLGLEKIEVNAAYSSFIGNIQHHFFDPINASLEIARRGITKYIKGSFFPTLSSKDRDTMCQFGLDVSCDTLLSWKDVYEQFVTSGLRYRRALDLSQVSDNYLHSYKSGIFIYIIV